MTPKEIRAAIRTDRSLGRERTPLVALAALVTRYLRALDGSGPVGGVGELDQALTALRAAVDDRHPVLTQAALEQALRDAGRFYEPAPGWEERVHAETQMTRWQRLVRWLRGGDRRRTDRS